MELDVACASIRDALCLSRHVYFVPQLWAGHCGECHASSHPECETGAGYKIQKYPRTYRTVCRALQDTAGPKPPRASLFRALGSATNPLSPVTL